MILKSNQIYGRRKRAVKFCGKEKISVIAIVCNVAKYLEECVESIKAQSYENIEIILVDDGSEDKSGEICDRIAETDNRIKVIHKENGGLVSARQAGIKEATGEYVAFVDGDDWVDQDMYEKLYLLAQLYQVDVVLSGIARELPEGKRCDCNVISNGYYDKDKMKKDIYPEMMYSMEKRCCLIDPSLCNKLFKREIIKEALLKVDPAIFYWGEDAATTYPYLLNINSMYVCDFCMYHHRIVVVDKDSSYKREYVLERLFAFYNNLFRNFSETNYFGIMQPQLNGYFLHLLNKAVKDGINLDMMLFYQKLYEQKNQDVLTNNIVRFKLPLNELEKYKRVVLYGAGKVGTEYYNQLLENNFEVVMWADKKWELYQNSGLKVENIENIGDRIYDIIILAAKREVIANSMKNDLSAKGFKAEKIKWVQPIVVN